MNELRLLWILEDYPLLFYYYIPTTIFFLATLFAIYFILLFEDTRRIIFLFLVEIERLGSRQAQETHGVPLGQLCGCAGGMILLIVRIVLFFQLIFFSYS